MANQILLRGGTILTLDATASVVEGDLLVEGNRISEIGSEIVAPTAEVVDISGSFLMPGLIQGHVHLGQMLFRGLGEGRRLLPWLKERIWPLEAAHTVESAYWGGLLGTSECLLSGTTCLQDIGIGPGAEGVLQAIVDSGLRAYAGSCLMDNGESLPPELASDTEADLNRAEELGGRFHAAEGRLRYVINPRFILSCSDRLWSGIRDLSERTGWPIHTHALEQEEETEAVRALKNGRDEMEYFDDLGILDQDLRIAHGVWLSKAHYGRVTKDRFSVVHCPSANLRLGSGLCDVVKHRSHGIKVGLGCDGVACNNGLDAFAELKLAALLQQVKNGPASFSGLEALRLATSEGARALNWDDEIGSLEVGKKADLVVLSRDSPALWGPPGSDPHDVVAFSASRADVRHVFVDGRHLVQDHRLASLDSDKIQRMATREAAALVARARL